MKILYTPLMIVPSLSAEQRAGILEAAGPGTVLVEAKEPARQRAEIVDTDILFGRVAPDIFVLNRRLRFYHSIGAGVDAVLSPELVQSDIPLASEKGGVGIHLAEHAVRAPPRPDARPAHRDPPARLRPARAHPPRAAGAVRIDDGHRGLRGVGREVARRALAFGMRVIGVDIEDVPPEPGVPDIWKTDRLYEMLGLADVVVIGLPLTKATRHLFTRDLFRRMKRTAILINVTRGEIIYGEDLLAALDEGLIWGAGLDVTDPEPLAKDHRLWTHPRVIVTPHTAGGSPRRAQRVIDTFCENLRRMRAGQPFIALIDKDKGY
jgi:phosphoglycerate dehydrogenase-like enzyme